MDTISRLRSVISLFSLPVFAVMLSFCARVGNPTGGPKDTDPPKVLSAKPPNFSTRFNAQSISIVFDEYIKLDNVNQKLVISPPLAERPDIRIRGKGIVIDLNSPLNENTTYTFNFGDAIADNNEGNILENFLYVFSTGNDLDSLETGGKIVDAYTLKAPEEAYAGLYDDLNDSAVLLQKPLYISKVDKKGAFALRNLKQDTFRMIGLADANGNLRYDPGVDMIGFLDSLLILDPEIFAPLQSDPEDTSAVAKKQKRIAGPDFYLRLFLEDVPDQYLKTAERPGDEFFHLIFNQPVYKNVMVRLLADTARTNWFLPEKFVVGDTLGYWFTDTSLIRQEKTDILISYAVTDSTGNWTFVTDTASLQKKRKVSGKPGRAKSGNTPAPVIRRAVITTSASSRLPLELNHDLVLFSATPVKNWDTSLIRFLRLQDTLQQPLPFSIKKDTFHLRNYILHTEWTPDTRYFLTLLPGAFTDIYGFSNDTLLISFQTRKTEDYGNFQLHLNGVSGKTILELLDDKMNRVRKMIIQSDTSVSFLYLRPSKYRIKALADENGNGKWDTGNFLEHRQPEPVSFFPKTLNVRANWDLDENWTIRFKR